MSTLALFAILSAAIFYLGSRALITRWLWSRYSPTFARFMDCAACTGFWLGAVLSLTLGQDRDPVFHSNIEIEAILVGLCMLVVTPMVAGLMQHSLNVVGDATIAPDDALLEPSKEDTK